MIISALDLKNTFEQSYCNELGGPLRYLPNIKHINILVGENNSGKSRFCRQLIKSCDVTILSDESESNTPNQLSIIKTRIRNALVALSPTFPSLTLSPLHDEMTASELFVFYQNQYDFLKLDNRNVSYPLNNSIIQFAESLKGLKRLVSLTNPHSQREELLIRGNRNVYIPVLRGIENFNLYFNIRNSQQLDTLTMNAAQRSAIDEYKSNASVIYKNKTCKAYDLSGLSVFTGENLYAEIRDKLLGHEEGRTFIREYESFISRYFFDNEGFTIIPIIKEGYLNVKIGNNTERPLHDLGDGIKQLICILYKVFEYKDETSVIIIEEPELNLHPGYQRRLLNILQLPEFKKISFFITTHSNHIVDSCFDYSDISLFKFRCIDTKTDSFQVINTSPNDIEILNLLGVNNSSVFMANSTIWVEGISDKIYISKYLKTYMEGKGLYVYKEGIDYSFVEYGGNNITHWSFADDEDIDKIKASGITNRALMIVDNDNGAKQTRKSKLKRVFGDDFIELPVREIENTIGNKLLEKSLFEGEPLYKDGMQNRKTSIETKSTYIWDYIDQYYILKKKYWNSRHKCPTISKSQFAKNVCMNITSIDDLSDTALQLCEQIYEFISRAHTEIG